MNEITQHPFHELAKLMRKNNATDLHLSADQPVMLRVHGKLVPLQEHSLTAEDIGQLLEGLMSTKDWARLQSSKEVDFSFETPGEGYFRANAYYKRYRISCAFRFLPLRIPSLDDLGMPESIRKLAELPSGLVLITGATGSGKSTTLASLINQINITRECHIVTIEDPIEYIHPQKRALISQREVNTDTDSFASALKAALRQDPDVVLLGEMRDLESIELALTLAETGHLTFGTLHTNSAIQSLTRLIDVFPAQQQMQVRTLLSFVLQAIVWQQLIPSDRGNSRVLAMEVLILTPAVRNMIRDGKFHEIYSAMQVGQDKTGMQTMNQALAKLVTTGRIDVDTAKQRSTEPEELVEMISRNAKGQVNRSHDRNNDKNNDREQKSRYGSRNSREKEA